MARPRSVMTTSRPAPRSVRRMAAARCLPLELADKRVHCSEIRLGFAGKGPEYFGGAAPWPFDVGHRAAVSHALLVDIIHRVLSLVPRLPNSPSLGRREEWPGVVCWCSMVVCAMRSFAARER